MEGKKLPKLPWPEWEYDGYLGHGGFGSVYRIRREEYGDVSYAALKIVRLPSDENEVRELETEGVSASSYYRDMVSDMKKEISLMVSLKGASNIVTIEDYKIYELKNDAGWILFIRMELLTDLNRYGKTHPMTKKQILKMGCDICDALDACSKKQIIHRDIKPSNILVAEEFGEFKLGDFGVSRKLEHTMSGLSRKGTQVYMAPEVYKGEKYNAEVDIYSLGLVIYRMLNGNCLPFEPKEKTSKAIQEAFHRRMLGEKFPDPEYGGKEIGDVLRKACHINPKKRYQSALEFKEALMNCQMQESSGKIYKKHDKKENSGSTKPKSAWKYAALGIGILAVVCTAAIGILQKEKPKDEAEQTAAEAVTLTPSAAPEPVVEEQLPPSQKYIAIADVNLRAEPHVESAVVSAIAAGTELDGIEVETNGWIQVEYNGMDGFVMAEFLQLEESAASELVNTNELYMGVSLAYPYHDERYQGFWEKFAEEGSKRGYGKIDVFDYVSSAGTAIEGANVDDQIATLKDITAKGLDILLIDYSDENLPSEYNPVSSAILDEIEKECYIITFNEDWNWSSDEKKISELFDIIEKGYSEWKGIENV